VPNKTSKAGPAYVERFRFTPMVIFTVLLCLVIAVGFVIIAVSTDMGDDPLGLALAGAVVAFTGGLAAFLLVAGWRQQVTLRVDAHGVTFGRPATPFSNDGLWFLVPPVTVPWSEIDAIVLFSRPVPDGAPQDFIGLLQRPADGPRARRSAGRRPDVRDALDGVDPCRQIYGWRVDRARLRQVARRNAPHVRVVQR
jgi:hypothetical protein